ncbi:MAG: HAMP domain-containing protein [Sedimentisphaerales bacterium]|nr:HAMP domain-containing protein [Sedimentisphaerales bacterium]
MKRRLLWQIFPSYLVITILALVAFSINVSFLVDGFLTRQTRQMLEVRARLVSSALEPLLETGDLSRMDALCKKLGQENKTRVTIIEPTGRVLGESDKDPQAMENHLNRPEIQQAMTGLIGFSERRPSTTLKQRMMYVAVGVQRDNQVVAVVRTAMPLVEIEHAIGSITQQVIRYAIIIAAVLAIVSLYFSWRLSRPLALLQQGARRFAQGQLTHKLDVGGPGEIAELAGAMNMMAEELNRRIEASTRQRNQQQAVFTAMLEGIIAFETEGKCLMLNTAAARLLQLDADKTTGRTVGELIHNSELQTFVQNALRSPSSAEQFILMPDADLRQDCYLQVRSSALLDSENRHIGALIVLNDMTRIYRLEQVRRDFVANVSHELKTPVTSIHGFIETLQDGAIHNPEDAKRFLGIIARQTDRLNSIIEDLLLLCELEQQGQSVHVPRDVCSIQEILKEAVELCRHKAEERNIRIRWTCSEDLKALVNASLLEQAVVNLVDNGIKYSNPDSDVSIDAKTENDRLVIRVQDKGCGIAAEHQDRIFERFYRVDKARSRQLGGTGLGLAIVKHIVQYHKGSISVQSIPGKGSTFVLSLPLDA